jgi:8-oxo-dGTP diphosphatase
VHGRIHVVAGVLRDADGQVLLTRRPAGKHLAGLWEFPGGKCEPGEPPEHALRRELREELGIEIRGVEKLIAVPWRYPQKSICLDVYNVLAHAGTIHGSEGQALRWLATEELATVAMPPADRPVVTALSLPRHYIITAEPDADDAAFLRALKRVLDAGETCIQLRSKRLKPGRLHSLVLSAQHLIEATGAKASLLLNGDIDLAREFGVGVHLPAAELMRLRERPLDAQHWVAASCHDERELAHAAGIGIDFAALGPVQSTPSHPHAVPLGWARFADLCAQAPFPVYALGGLNAADFFAAREAGAHGVAGISAFWPS